MNKSLSRNIAFWLLLVLSLVSALVGGWLIASQLGTMTTTLLDGTATGVEVYVGQSLVVVGAAALGAGIVGVLLAVGLAAVSSLVPRRAIIAEEASPIVDESAEPTTPVTEAPTTETPLTEAPEAASVEYAPSEAQTASETGSDEVAKTEPAITR
jgi:hypothetical protein